MRLRSSPGAELGSAAHARPAANALPRVVRAAVALTTLVLLVCPAPSLAAEQPDAGVSGAPAGDASLKIDARRTSGGVVPAHFVGFSIEWSLVERYMGPSARPAFASLLRNLGTGLLRIGGSSQDLMPFDAAAENTDRVITPAEAASRGLAYRGRDRLGEHGVAASPAQACDAAEPPTTRRRRASRT